MTDFETAVDDEQEAYDEAASHLEVCADECNDEGQKTAYRLVAERIRQAAKIRLREIR